MSNRSRIRLLVVVLVLLAAARADACIGPGARFALAGSFLAFVCAIASAFLTILTWPFRLAVRMLFGEAQRLSLSIPAIGFDRLTPRAAWLAQCFPDHQELGQTVRRHQTHEEVVSHDEQGVTIAIMSLCERGLQHLVRVDRDEISLHGIPDTGLGMCCPSAAVRSWRVSTPTSRPRSTTGNPAGSRRRHARRLGPMCRSASTAAACCDGGCDCRIRSPLDERQHIERAVQRVLRR
jgi:hypothetical protein